MSREEATAVIDAYFLGERTDRERIFSELAQLRTDIEGAAPIMRALVLVGARAADESLMALRLTLALRSASDAAVGSVKRAVHDMRCGDPRARERYLAAVGDLP